MAGGKESILCVGPVSHTLAWKWARGCDRTIGPQSYVLPIGTLLPSGCREMRTPSVWRRVRKEQDSQNYQ